MVSGKNDEVMFDIVSNLLIDNRQPIAFSDIYLFDQISFRSKSKEQLNERRAGLSSLKAKIQIKLLSEGLLDEGKDRCHNHL